MNYKDEFPVSKMCIVLKVSRSGYYDWLKKRAVFPKRKIELNQKIKEVFDASRKTYGSPRIYAVLKKLNIKTSESTVARQMKLLNISPVRKKKFKITTDSKHELKVSPNLVNRNFSVSDLGKVWVGDITYIRMGNSFTYLTTVMDLADRMIIGWHLSDNMTDKDTTIAAFNKAIKNRPVASDLIFHSDRGSQYASHDFRTLLKKEKCIQSMSRKGNCWDNAVAESFFKTIKSEELNRHKFKTMEQIYSAVFDYIEGWYNTKRIHSALGAKSPREMYILLAAKKVA